MYERKKQRRFCHLERDMEGRWVEIGIIDYKYPDHWRIYVEVGRSGMIYYLANDPHDHHNGEFGLLSSNSPTNDPRSTWNLWTNK